MINIADLPAVRGQFERVAAASEEQSAAPTADADGVGAPRAYSVADLPAVKNKLASESAPAPVEYARAPDGPGYQAANGRPPATQRNSR
jgi:hypothetical protein